MCFASREEHSSQSWMRAVYVHEQPQKENKINHRKIKYQIMFYMQPTDDLGLISQILESR